MTHLFNIVFADGTQTRIEAVDQADARAEYAGRDVSSIAQLDDFALYGKTPTLTALIRAATAYVGDTVIECDTAFSTVAIGSDIFLQGQEADEFNDAAERLWNETGDTTIDECRAHLARPYLDCLA